MHNPIKQRTFDETAGNEMKFYKDSTSPEMFFCSLCDKKLVAKIVVSCSKMHFNLFVFFPVSYNVGLKEMHDKMHSNAETFMCLQCNRKFTDAEHLELHLRAHNEARVVSFPHLV